VSALIDFKAKISALTHEAGKSNGDGLFEGSGKNFFRKNLLDIKNRF
jgi:hypothetical protein